MSSSGKSPASSCLKGVVVLGALGGIGYGIWHWLGRPDGQEILDFGNDFAGNFDFGDIWDNDPSLGSNATNTWENKGSGIQLKLLNALDETWQDEFVMAVADWDASNSLTLTTQDVTPESACSHQDDVMKVCNGNYGKTGWLGINEIMSTAQEGGTIVSSVAKMNEFYLMNSDQDERQYTMCHELGHGFGLPHTDENFNNADLGNCLDYTRTPKNNLHPDAGNFAFLAELYGTFRRTLRRRMVGELNRHRPRRHLSRALYEEALSELEQEWTRDVNLEDESGARRLVSQTYSKNIAGGFKLQVSVLFA
jgi:hypothetical protein